MCSAPGCKENHAYHHCQVCQDGNSTHLARNCPKGIDLYHGTRVSNIASIVNGGLYPSPNGRIGPGIYFASQQVANSVAAHRNQGTGVAVIKARVNQAKCKTGTHPPWHGVINAHFQEWCLVGGNYKVSAVYLKDGEVTGGFNDSQIDLHTSGTCKLSGGNITLGTLVISGNMTIG